VLFLCTGNSARSQIAEALLLRKGGGRFRVASAGVHPAGEVHPEAVTALAEIGIDWSGRTPKGLDAVSRDEWDVIITTCDKIRETCPSFPGQPIYAHWNVPDPVQAAPELRRRAFADVVQLLAWRIDLMLMARRGRENLAEIIRRAGSGDPQRSEVSPERGEP
jgi:protein-tyrosine-phosphatase